VSVASGVPYGMQLIFEMNLLCAALDEFVDFVEFIRGAGFESTGIVENKTLSCRIQKCILDIVLSTLNFFELPQRNT
jgi:hypothetical protein